MTVPWVPMVRIAVDPDFERKVKLFAPGLGAPLCDEVWDNREYQCIVRYLGRRGKAGGLHLSLKRHDREPAQDWRHLQAIKNEVCGWEREAVQLHPAESRLVDQANQTHLWVLEAGEQFPIGFAERVVLTQEESEAAVIAALGEKGRGRQRDWQPNISTGPEYRA